MLVFIISSALVLISVAFTRPTAFQSTRFSQYAGAALLQQSTATPETQADRSEIGSTDYITLASFIIVAIIIIPLVIKRKSWTQV